jgi:hypothetical protein
MAWKLVFALATTNKWLIYKIDMISAFTQGDIDTSIYLLPPKGLIDLYINLYPDLPIPEEPLLKLNKALYSLKQLARIWYNTLANILVNKLGFRALRQEPCIFINKAKDLIICVYVDDLTIISPNINLINSFIAKIKEYFNIKELGLIKDYLGIDIDYNLDKGIMKLNQKKYIDKLVERFNLLDSLPTYIPLDPKIKLLPNTEKAPKEDIKLF